MWNEEEEESIWKKKLAKKTGIVKCEEKRLECRTWHNAERERERDERG